MPAYDDPRPIIRALIHNLERSTASEEWKHEMFHDMAGRDPPPQWVADARRTLNEAKQFLAMLNGTAES